MKETQRLYPVAPVVRRQIAQDMQYNGMTFPKNSIIAVHLYAMGRQNWIHDVTQFQPERWASTIVSWNN